MNKGLKFIECLCLVIVIFLTGCQKQNVKEDLSPYSEKKDTYLEQELAVITDYLKQAENPGESEDSLDVEFYYARAQEEIAYLAPIYKEHPAFITLQSEVMESYQNYLTELETEESDSLSAGFVMQQIGDLYDADITTNSSLAENTPRLKIPIETNTRVEKTIKYFTKGKGKKVFRRWLERAGTYRPMVQAILKEEGAPEELFYLAMIESGFNPKARSWARAVGMWQFIAATGKAYGLTRSWWHDDRRDPAKATRAAARHLMDLYNDFGDWYLAIAGYNFNPAKIKRRIRKYKVDSYWELPRLPRETRGYVPSFLAAVTIASNAEAYGFGDVVPYEAMVFDTMTVTECVDLNVVAKAIGSTYKELKDLNPAILRWCTPPDAKKWVLNLPQGKRDLFAQKYAEIPKEKKVSWVHHRIRSGETLSTIARRYDVSMYEIKRFNKIKGSMIRAGKSLVIPIPANGAARKRYYAEQKKNTTPRRTKPIEKVAGKEKHEYVVRSGDSLWDIATEFKVTLSDLRKWNGLGRSRLIKPGQKLNIWLPQDKAKVASQPALAQNTPPPAKASSIPIAAAGSDGSRTHKVSSGETLWDIAQTYKVSIRDIKKWNGKRSNTIHPGDELRIMPK